MIYAWHVLVILQCALFLALILRRADFHGISSRQISLKTLFAFVTPGALISYFVTLPLPWHAVPKILRMAGIL